MSLFVSSAFICEDKFVEKNEILEIIMLRRIFVQ